MVASFVVLIYFLAKEGLLKRVLETGDKINSKRLLVDTIKEAIPFYSDRVCYPAFPDFWTR